MPPTTYLHIQTRGETATRVVTLAETSARIGRGPQCEIRLPDPALAEVQCLLRRRGDTWHIQPVGPAGMLTIEGRPVDAQRPLAHGMTLRVGDHWLTLRPAGAAGAPLGSFDAPIPVELRVVVPDEPEVSAEPEPKPTAGPRTPGAHEAERDRLRRWQEQLEERERWLKARQDERRWEARWRAAGEALRSRPATPVRPAAAEPPQRPSPADRFNHRRPTTPSAPANDHRPAPPSPFPQAARASLIDTAPSVAPAAVEPAPLDPEVRDFRALWNDEVATPPAEAIAPAVEPIPTPPAIEEPPILEPATAAVAPEDEAEAAIAEPAESVEIVAPETIEPEPTAPAVEPTKPARRRFRFLPSRPAAAVMIPEPVDDPATADPNAAEEELAPSVEIAPEPEAEDPEAEAPALAEVTPTEEIVEAEPTLSVPVEPIVRPEPVWTGAQPFVTDTQLDLSDWVRHDDRPGFHANVAEPEVEIRWPTAASILDATRMKQEPRPAARARATRPAVRRPEPTSGVAPSSWKVPFWLGWLGTAALVLPLGVLGLGLSGIWAMDDRAAGLVADRVLDRDTLPEGPIIDPALVPPASWWRSTPGHLYLQALAAARTPDDTDVEERVRFLLGVARNAGPLEPAVRYALARTGGHDGGVTPGAGLGLSRDVIALAWTGRELLDAGKLDTAVPIFRNALELAVGARPDPSAEPAFDDDPQVRRFALPGEELIGPVVREMADHADWSFERWSAALPTSPLVALAAYRILREKGSPDADRALELAAAEPAAGTEPRALDFAARAEALAFLERAEEAESTYRQAIAAMPTDLVRRCWWLNVASIATRRGDEAATREGWEHARGPRAGDPVGRRVAEAQTRAGLGSSRERAADTTPLTPRF